MTAQQWEALRARLQVLGEHADSARLIEERFGTVAACSHCASRDVVRFGQSHGRRRFRRKACGKTFMALTCTPFLRLREKGKLLTHFDWMRQSWTIRDIIAQAVGLTVDCAFRWHHRFLAFLVQYQPEHMTGVVEADETFFRRSYKGQRKGVPRAAKTRGGPMPEGSDDERVGVLVAMQRGARIVSDGVLPDLSAAALTQAPPPALSADAVLSTDGNPSYGVVAANLGIEASCFVASYHAPGGTGIWRVQNINASHSGLKGWMYRFHGVATKCLHHYLGWRRLLDRFKDSVTAEQLVFHALRPRYVNI